MEYKRTINLPKTSFSMKANLSRLEPEMQRRWSEGDLYGRIRGLRAGSPKYVLHDGPPYPTGDLHIGTGLNKILKDFIVRFRTMRGYDAPYVPGWDCHGLPIEHRVMQDLGEKRAAMSKPEIRERCRAWALKFVELQKKQFQSLGVLGDWDRPYLTLNPGYEQGILEVFAEMVGGGYVYRGLKPIHWCLDCETALAEAELEYGDETSPSIYVNFPLVDSIQDAFSLEPDERCHIMIWTTTPWTLPANRAVAVHPFSDYCAVRYSHPRSGESLVSILATDLTAEVMEACGVGEFHILGSVKGDLLSGLRYRHPLADRVCPVVLADYVTLTDGTGCVHTAPGHGQEDYLTGLKYGLEIASPVDGRGTFTEEAGKYAGLSIGQDGAIVEDLAKSGLLLKSDRLAHPYPHCWRCHEPVIFRATEQWFVGVDHEGFREKVLEAVHRTQWVPPWGEQRIADMVGERPDWCISRQRSWGVPIPAFYCKDCGAVLLTRESVQVVAEVFSRKGSDAWFREESEAFLAAGTACAECGGTSFEKETDIFDVWFESGSSHHSVCRKHEALGFPADLYLEGTDQYRGWFQLSLLPSMAAWGEPPYRTVLTHGFVVDDQGRKMSKSLGNFISAEEGVALFRAEVLRLWCSSVDYRSEISVNRDYIQKNMVDAYRRVRNTFRYLLGNLHDFDPARDAVAYEDLGELDRWALDATERLVRRTTEAFEAFDLHKVYGGVHNFCAVEMSSFYLDVIKDRLYCSGAAWAERRAAQTVLAHVLSVLVRLTAPILVHTSEEVWEAMPFRPEEIDSVHLSAWPVPQEGYLDEELHRRWSGLLAVRGSVLRVLEGLRAGKEIGQSLEASVRLAVSDERTAELLASAGELLREITLVSEVTVARSEGAPEGAAWTAAEGVAGLWVAAAPSGHAKCLRCWNLRSDVGADEGYADLCERCARAVAEIVESES
jgi:isoleucyl-tRNA synthetase